MRKFACILASVLCCACSADRMALEEQLFEIAAVPQTKVSLDDMSVSWKAGDKIKVFHALAGSSSYVSDGEFTITQQNLSKGIFTGKLAAALLPDKSYDWYFLYGMKEGVAVTPQKATFFVNTVADESGSGTTSDLEPVVAMYGVVKGLPSSQMPSAPMRHLTSYVCFNVRTPELGRATVQKVRMKASSPYVAGTWTANVTSGEAVFTSGKGTQVTAYAVQGVKTGQTISMYSAICPVTVPAGETLTLTVFTSAGSFDKKLTLPSAMEFVPGKMKRINVALPADKMQDDPEVTVDTIWDTDPASLEKDNADNMRFSCFRRIDDYSYLLSADDFKAYLGKSEAQAVQDEATIDILTCYRLAFDRVFSEMRSYNPAYGTAYVWELYNMGFVVKTPSVCFGIDINHRLAVQMAPYLDFLLVTHNHADHKADDLVNAMVALGKPVVSHFYTQSSSWCSPNERSFKIGNVQIRTSITPHGGNSDVNVTLYRIHCGEDSGNLDILHGGDSNFDTSLMSNVGGGSPSLLVLRFGDPDEDNAIGSGPGQVNPKYVFMSHCGELRHVPNASPRRIMFYRTMEKREQNIHFSPMENCLIPFWGDRFKWDGNSLTGNDH